MLTEDGHDRTLKSFATFLSRWRGAHGQMWELTVSHRTLRLVLRRDFLSLENLMLSCIDPYRLRGPITWSNAEINVSRVVLPEDGTDGFLVADEPAGVEVHCGALEIRENVKLF